MRGLWCFKAQTRNIQIGIVKGRSLQPLLRRWSASNDHRPRVTEFHLGLSVGGKKGDSITTCTGGAGGTDTHGGGMSHGRSFSWWRTSALGRHSDMGARAGGTISRWRVSEASNPDVVLPLHAWRL